jgi:glycosyltransferase involved in cell wall biosynthesis
MRILYIANGNGTSTSIGGSLKRTIEISKRLIKSGNSVTFLTTPSTAELFRSRGVDAEFRLARASFSTEKGTSGFDRMREYIISTVSSLLHAHGVPAYDIIYNDSDYFCDVIPAIVYKYKSGAKWTAMTHHMIRPRENVTQGSIVSRISATMQKFSYWLFEKFADAVFVYDSDAGRDISRYLFDHGYPKDAIYYVMNGVSLQEIEDIPISGVPKYDACFVGVLRPLKGIYDLVPVWKEVVHVKPAAHLMVVGGGLEKYEKELKAQIDSEKLNGNITLAGEQPWPETIKAIKQSRIFVSTSYEEGWGIAVCEAMACCRPVIAYQLPAFAIFDDHLIRAPLGDTKLLAQGILQLLGNDAVRDQMGITNRQFSARFDWNKIAENELNLFYKIAREG